MTPEQKAKELVEKFKVHTKMWDDYRGFEVDEYSAKECALIAVEEILKEHCHESENKNPIAQERWIAYWVEVKEEITKL